MNGIDYFFAALLTEDEGNKVPDLSRVLWFAGGLLAVIGILVFFFLAVFLAIGDLHAPAGAVGHFDLLKQYAEAYAMVFTGFGAAMGLCGAALALKTKSGA